MHEEPGQSPAASTSRGVRPSDGGLILNPDSWRKIRETTANVYPDGMLNVAASRLSRMGGLPMSAD
jgi:hypothetical protein